MSVLRKRWTKISDRMEPERTVLCRQKCYAARPVRRAAEAQQCGIPAWLALKDGHTQNGDSNHHC
jgi:hypothetical protein